jgi:hypothetical protein
MSDSLDGFFNLTIVISGPVRQIGASAYVETGSHCLKRSLKQAAKYSAT